MRRLYSLIALLAGFVSAKKHEKNITVAEVALNDEDDIGQEEEVEEEDDRSTGSSDSDQDPISLAERHRKSRHRRQHHHKRHHIEREVSVDDIESENKKGEEAAQATRALISLQRQHARIRKHDKK